MNAETNELLKTKSVQIVESEKTEVSNDDIERYVVFGDVCSDLTVTFGSDELKSVSEFGSRYLLYLNEELVFIRN